MFRLMRVLLPVVLLAVALVACQSAQEATSTPSSRSTPAAAAATATKAPATTAPTPTAEKPRRGGVFKAAFPSDVVTFDPHAPTTVMQHGMPAIYGKLIKLNQALELAPDLTESWELAKDGLSVTMKLRKGVKFHDGTDFNAQAAKFSLDRALTIKPTAASYGDIEAIKEVQVVDDYTIKLNLKNTSGILLYGLADLGGMMVSPAAVQKWDKDYAFHPVGTGPYEFVEWIKNDHYTVKRFEGYFDKDKAGFFDQLVYQVIPDDATRLAALRSGQIHYVDTVPAKDIATLQADSNVTFAEVPSWGWYLLRMNTTKPPFDKKEVRQAANYAVDRDAVVKTVFLGHGVPAKGPLSPTTWAYKEGNVEGYPYSVDKAKQKLAEAGVSGGVKFKMLVPINPEFQQEAQVIQAQFAKAGLEAEIDLKDPATTNSLVTAGDYQMWVNRWSGYLDPHFNLFRPYHIKGYGSAKFIHVEQAEPLIEKAAQLTDRAERAKVYQEIERIVVDYSPEIWVFHYMENVAFNKKIKGIKAMPGRYYTSSFIPNAWFAE